MVAGLVEKESRQTKPAVLGAVVPVADLDLPFGRIAVLRPLVATGDLLDGRRVTLVPIRDGVAQDPLPLAVDVIHRLHGELAWLPRPVEGIRGLAGARRC